MAGGGGGPNSILNKRETFQQDIERLNKQQYMQVHDVYMCGETGVSPL